MHWRRLDREQTQSVLTSVTSADEAGLFSSATSEVERSVLPFYKTYMAYKVTNYASLPSFSFQYLGDGEFFHFLDGSSDSIQAVNDKGQLALDERNIVDYLGFYFESVGLDDGEECHLIQNPADMPLFESLDESAEIAIIRNHKTPEVTSSADLFTVSADLYVDGQVIRATIEVKRGSGRVSVLDQTMIWNALGMNNITETIG